MSNTIVPVSFTAASGGLIATGDKAITFEITERTVPGGHVIGREFDIFESPSGEPAVLPGDCDQNEVANFFDIAPFIAILSGNWLDSGTFVI